MRSVEFEILRFVVLQREPQSVLRRWPVRVSATEEKDDEELQTSNCPAPALALVIVAALLGYALADDPLQSGKCGDAFGNANGFCDSGCVDSFDNTSILYIPGAFYKCAGTTVSCPKEQDRGSKCAFLKFSKRGCKPTDIVGAPETKPNLTCK